MATNQSGEDPGGYPPPDQSLVYDRNKPWWQNPAPAGWTGAWPPPLEAGDTYGPEVGQVNYTPEHAAQHSGVHGNTTTNTGGGGGGGGWQLSDWTKPWGGVWTPPTPGPGVPETPEFHFTAPTYEQALAEPGYQFAAGEGRRLMEQGAAAKGVLNTGGTLRDVNAWGTNFAATKYNDVYGRAYQRAQDEFAPKMTAYSTQAAANQRSNEWNYSNAWNKYLFDYQAFRNWQNDSFDKYFKTSAA